MDDVDLAPTLAPPLSAIPADIRNAQDYAALAPHFMAPSHLADIGGGYGQSVAANATALAQWAIYPRLLRDVSHGHTRIRLAGEDYAHPLFLARWPSTSWPTLAAKSTPRAPRRPPVPA